MSSRPIKRPPAALDDLGGRKSIAPKVILFQFLTSGYEGVWLRGFLRLLGAKFQQTAAFRPLLDLSASPQVTTFGGAGGGGDLAEQAGIV